MPPMLPPLAERRPDLAVAAADLRLTVGAESFAFATTAELDAPGDAPRPEARRRGPRARPVDALSRLARVRRRAIPAPAAAPPSPGCSRGSRPRLPVPPDRVFVTRFSAPDRPRLLTLPPGARRRARPRDGRAAPHPAAAAAAAARGPRAVAPARRAGQALRRRGGAGGGRPARARRGRRLRPGADRRGPAVAPRDRAGQGRPAGAARAAPGIAVAGGVRGEGGPPARRSATSCATSAAPHATASGGSPPTCASWSRLRPARWPTRRSATSGATCPTSRSAPYLAELRDDIVAAVVELADAGPDAMEHLGRRLERYRVNVVADRTGLTGAPVVTERFPGRQNLTGSIDRIQDGPMSFRADASTIRGGALLAGRRRVPDRARRRGARGARRLGGAEAHARDGPARHRRRRRRPARACPGRSSPTRCRSTSRS